MAAGEGTVWSDMDTAAEVPTSVLRTSSVAGLIMRRRSTANSPVVSAKGAGTGAGTGTGGAVPGTGAAVVEPVSARRGLSRRVKGQEQRERQGIAGDADGSGEWWRRNASKEKDKAREGDKASIPKASLLRDFFRSALYTRKAYSHQPWADASLDPPAQRAGTSSGTRSPAAGAATAASGGDEKGGIEKPVAGAAASGRGRGGGGGGVRTGLMSRTGMKSSRTKAAGVRVWLRLGASGEMQVRPLRASSFL